MSAKPKRVDTRHVHGIAPTSSCVARLDATAHPTGKGKCSNDARLGASNDAAPWLPWEIQFAFPGLLREVSVLVSARRSSPARITVIALIASVSATFLYSRSTESAERRTPRLHTVREAHGQAQATAGKHNPPVVTITPRGRLVTTGSITVDVKLCQPYAPSAAFGSPTLKLDGVDITTSFSYVSNGQDTSCEYYENWQGTVTLQTAPLTQAFTAKVIDGSNYQGEDAVTYGVPASWRGVLVSADAGSATPTASSTGNTAGFTIWNTGEVSTTYSLSATCAGPATPSTCSLSPSSLTIAAGGSGTAGVTYTASSTPGDTAGITLAGVDNGDANVSSVGYTGVSVISAPSAGYAFARSTTTLHRGACVTVALSRDAAMECGRLRIPPDALPAVTTLGKARIPTLLYNSALARPRPIIQVDATIASQLNPTQGQAAIYENLGGWQMRGYTDSPASAWGSGSTTRRMSLEMDVSNRPTSLTDYAIQVGYVGGSSNAWYTDGFQLAIVDRSASPFGAGWWLAGLEQLVVVAAGYTLMWVGGDGSTTVYRGGGGTFVADAFDRPDTITYNSGTAEYTRHGPADLDVKFNSSGYHISTTNRLGQVTRFTYVPGTHRLDSLIVPVRSGTPLAYRFVYNGSNLLDSVIAPGPSALRKVKINRSGAAIASIRDADSTLVSFAYGSGADANRINSRTDRRGNTTHFFYNSFNQLTRDSVSLGGAGFIRQILRPAEAASLTRGDPAGGCLHVHRRTAI